MTDYNFHSQDIIYTSIGSANIFQVANSSSIVFSVNSTGVVVGNGAGLTSIVSSSGLLDSISGSFNGSTTTFNLTIGSIAVTPSVPQNLLVVLGGVIQSPGSAYTVSGSTITFATAPVASDSCFMILTGTGFAVAGTIVANSGLVSNSSGVFVVANTGITANSSGVFATGSAPVGNSGITSNSSGIFVKANNGLVANSSGLFAFGSTAKTRNSSSLFFANDVGCLIRHTDSSNYTWTIDVFSNTGIIAGSTITGTCESTGTVTIVPPTGGSLIRLDGTSGTGNRTVAAASMFTLLQLDGANAWGITGSSLS